MGVRLESDSTINYSRVDLLANLRESMQNENDLAIYREFLNSEEKTLLLKNRFWLQDELMQYCLVVYLPRRDEDPMR